MPSERLDIDHIRNLVKSQESKERKQRAPSWLNEKEIVPLQDALKAEQEYVVLKGRRFHIRYESHDSCYISPVGGGAPCGWFLIDRVMEASSI